ncbi:hypothetical protein ACFXKW_23765 [Streptomyces sp. NPDC059193]|uniref:hypothetical protein n=1 Tax=Streptomyces sp. NPDC059193 TaxID=3346763 RepID=UPI0036B1A5A2
MTPPLESEADTATRAHTQRPPDSMPLWQDSPAPAHDTGRAEDPEHEDVWAAWDEICNGAPAAEVQMAVAADVAALNQKKEADKANERPTTISWAPVEPATATAPAPRNISQAAAAVDSATAVADSHAASLEDHPEWQRIQTIRGSLRHVWDVMKEKAGAAWDDLRADVRFQGFWRTLSVRACEAISTQAAALADRLRPGTGNLPTADALLKLSAATLNYSTAAEAGRARTPTPTSGGEAAEPPMQRLTTRPTPTAYATREDAVRAAAEVTAHFQTWITSPMGQELADSSHRRVAAFRNAWHQLPPHPSNPAQAVGPYGSVAEHARALVTAAVGQGRFTPADLQALHTLAQAADQHAARLSVTLPPATARTAPKPTLAPPAVATPTLPKARSTPRASA